MLSFGTSVRSGRGPAALAAGLVWAGVAASLTLWWLHLPKGPVPAATVASMARSADADKKPGAVERALGHTAPTLAAPDVQKRFALIGVIATGTGQGSALLVVDGQPARAFLRGQAVAEGWRLSSVGPAGVRLEPLQSGASVELMLPQQR